MRVISYNILNRIKYITVVPNNIFQHRVILTLEWDFWSSEHLCCVVINFEQSLLSQHFLVEEILQSFNHLCAPSLSPLALSLSCTKTDTALHLWPAELKNYLPWSSCNTLSNTVSLFFSWVTWSCFHLSIIFSGANFPHKLPTTFVLISCK